MPNDEAPKPQPLKPDRGFFESLEGKDPQINEIIETLHQDGIGSPLYVRHVEKNKPPEDTLSRIEAIQADATTTIRNEFVGVSLPVVSGDANNRVVILLNSGRFYVLEEVKSDEGKLDEHNHEHCHRLTRQEGYSSYEARTFRRASDVYEELIGTPTSLQNLLNVKLLLDSSKNSSEEFTPILESAFMAAKEVRDERMRKQAENQNAAYNLFKRFFGSQEGTS